MACWHRLIRCTSKWAVHSNSATTGAPAETEYATDLIFRQPQHLAALYPQWLHHAIRRFGSADVLRFLGRVCPNNFTGEVTSVRSSAALREFGFGTPLMATRSKFTTNKAACCEWKPPLFIPKPLKFFGPWPPTRTGRCAGKNCAEVWLTCGGGLKSVVLPTNVIWRLWPAPVAPRLSKHRPSVCAGQCECAATLSGPQSLVAAGRNVVRGCQPG